METKDGWMFKNRTVILFVYRWARRILYRLREDIQVGEKDKKEGVNANYEMRVYIMRLMIFDECQEGEGLWTVDRVQTMRREGKKGRREEQSDPNPEFSPAVPR